ncbi:hypothetical protein CDL12_16525 [Handroanthus impetiginosus]|uniref:C3H1-type domain-containing protein n=1 Tax=Handroanthus impetiginosus TaxID=429701 RepID=A0A2G9H024_9LAMI|nr:hypothetical protein CDL12_16525 [Handroanthus impetiginosus]
MGERRKRKSLWDAEGETRHFSGMGEHNSWTGKEHHSGHNSGRYHEFSASGTYTALRSRDHSGHPSWESIEETPVASRSSGFIRIRHNAPEGKELGGGNRDYQNMSPGFDGMERRKYDHSHENDQSHSRRYLGRGRSRSRSRSRTRGRSRSGSLSRGRGRSRSRSRSDGGGRGVSRSRSPVGDYRRQSYGWGERRSVPDKSSQICRDFAAGRCRKGTQCRFLHPKNVSREDGDHIGDDTAERSRNRTDRGQISKHSYSRGHGFDLRGDVSAPYHGEDEQFPNKSRSAVPCKDFMKGKCRWGDNCRFSHHFASDETFGRGARYTSFDKDIEHQSHNSGKPLCKYFAAGRCDRDNCRFSHEDPKFNSLEGRQCEVTDGQSSHDNSNQWNGRTWNDATRILDNVKSGGWGETTVPITNSSSETTEAKNVDKWASSPVNENRSWGMPEWTNSSVSPDKQPSPPVGSGGYGGNIGTTESSGKENLANEQEHLLLHGLQLQNKHGNPNVLGQGTLQEDASLPMKAWQQNVSPVSHMQQQQQGVVESNLVRSVQSDVLDELKVSTNTTHPIPLSGQIVNQNGESALPGHSSISNETDVGQHMLHSNPSNGVSGDLNGPETHLVAPLNWQSQMQNHQKAVQVAGMVQQFFPNTLTSEQSAQLTNSQVAVADQHVAPVTNPPLFPTPIFSNEQSQKNAAVEVPNTWATMPSFPNTLGNVPLINTTNVQPDPVRVSHIPVNPVQNGGDTNEQGNHAEQNYQIQVGQSSLVPAVGTESDDSKMGHLGSPKLKQETVLANPEVDDCNKATSEESKGVQNNKQSEILDGNGKAEEGSANKDDKGMRIFKNSLIEFVKDILKPTWKEGRMSREVHKTIVKKVVDKVTSTIQPDHIPRTQEKVEQYLSFSKPKIAKLVQAYVGRCLKTES